ncbi:MAG: hypothetical protein HQK98_11090 [Nitrospirae bacterium]|nr:hypothetical protein [Nitrospirota bacterium]
MEKIIYKKRSYGKKEKTENSPSGRRAKYRRIEENYEVRVDTYGGKAHVQWNPEAAVTPLGQIRRVV